MKLPDTCIHILIFKKSLHRIEVWSPEALSSQPLTELILEFLRIRKGNLQDLQDLASGYDKVMMLYQLQPQSIYF